MTVDWTHGAAVDIRKYLLKELYASNIIKSTDYTQDFGVFDPVIPIQQLPEVINTNSDLPFVVYDMTPLSTVSDQYWIVEEEITFYVYSVDYGKVLAIQNLIVDIFRRHDLTAMDINGYVTSPNTFLCVYLVSSSAPEPAVSEGGRVGASITINYQYTRSIGANGRFAS